MLSIEDKTVREKAAWYAQSTVQDILGRIKKQKVLKSLPRCGRKRKTTPRIDQKILTLVENSVRPNATDIAKLFRKLELVNISPRTFRNRLHEYDLHGRTIAKNRYLPNDILQRGLR